MLNKKVRAFHDLCGPSDTLLLDEVFENFRSMCLKIKELDLAHFLSAPRLAWDAAFKKAKAKLDLLTDILLILCLSFYLYVINGMWKINTYRKYLDVNNLYGHKHYL